MGVVVRIEIVVVLSFLSGKAMPSARICIGIAQFRKGDAFFEITELNSWFYKLNRITNAIMAIDVSNL